MKSITAKVIEKVDKHISKEKQMKNVVVVGGGAAGMMAAYAAAKNGNNVTVCERNEKLGKKIYITGKGRCNFTNDCDEADFLENVFENMSFMYSAIYTFSPFSMMELMESAGLEIKTERGGRVFPASDKASDVTKTLSRLLEKNSVKILYNSLVKSIVSENGAVHGVRLENGQKISADSVILCCGGKSYPQTGSDGNGYKLASNLGHSIIYPLPALVGMNARDKAFGKLAGLSLKNVEVSLWENGIKKATEFGEMLFTHSGVSGPCVLTLSCKADFSKRNVISIDLKPALDEKKLDGRILRDFEEQKNREFKNSLIKLLPSSLCEFVVKKSGIPPEKRVNQIGREERKNLIKAIKFFDIEVESLGSFSEAIITRGGVDIKDVNSSTMESRLIKGLYFAGELLAVHGFTGGYNLQIAFSTGYLAGTSV